MSNVKGMHRRPTGLLAILLLMLLGMASLSACNTWQGAGQDVENAGDAVKDAVD